MELTNKQIFDKIRECLDNIIAARNAIMDLYSDSLYEDTWDADTEYVFEENLDNYEKALNELESIYPKFVWKNPENKKKFNRKMLPLIKEDAKTYKLVKVRHDAYQIYYKRRKAIVAKLNDACKFVLNRGTSILYLELFDFFNQDETCNKIPIWGKDEYGRDCNILYDWFYDGHQHDVRQRVSASPMVSQSFDIDEIARAFNGYVKCRIAAYQIFNMMTSADEYNGYDKYHNDLYKYVNGDITGAKLKSLYDNSDHSNITGGYEKDYFQTMDKRTFDAKGMNESAWDDIFGYMAKKEASKTKENISRINMLSKDSNKCRIIIDDNKVYANATFYPGDIVEICPTRKIDKSSLYSRDMRDIVFEVVKNNEWVVPFGYCQYYSLSDHNNPANVDFTWDPVKRVIVITALNKIPKYSLLWLNNIK